MRNRPALFTRAFVAPNAKLQEEINKRRSNRRYCWTQPGEILVPGSVGAVGAETRKGTTIAVVQEVKLSPEDVKAIATMTVRVCMGIPKDDDRVLSADDLQWIDELTGLITKMLKQASRYSVGEQVRMT